MNYINRAGKRWTDGRRKEHSDKTKENRFN